MNNRINIVSYSLCLILILSVAALAQTSSPSPFPVPSPSPSPTPPANDIFLIDVVNQNGRMKFGAPVKITEWNGYNNQPFFLPDGQSLLYTSIRADKQADIYRYEIKSGKTSRVTETPESEYSPTVMPGGNFLSVVRVEADSTQRLWKFSLAGGTPILILEKIKPVGYHTWIDENTLALFVLGQQGKPNTLQIVDAQTEKAEVIAENIGRTIRRIPHQNRISFVHKVSDQEWVIKTFDLKTHEISSLTRTLPGSEEYAWTPASILLMAKDSKLFSWNPKDPVWWELANFGGLKNITRIAVSTKGDRMAVVARQTAQ